MNCLTDIEIQTAADDERSARTIEHLRTCEKCRARVADRRQEMADLAAVVAAGGALPEAAASRMQQAITTGGPRGGSTALRRVDSPAPWHRTAWVPALAVAAGIVLVVYVILPRFGAPTSLSAAQILGRSLDTLAIERGIEIAEYQLTLTGLAATANRIEQVVDREHPARYRVMNYGPDGVLESAISQDPSSGRRTHLIRVDGRNYVVHVVGQRSTLLSLPELARAQVEVVITMMQATSDQKLTAVDQADGRQYVIEIPPVIPTGTVATHDLYRARAVIDADDFRLMEFDASGTMLKEPYSVSFRLIRHSRLEGAAAAAVDFAIHPGPGDVVLEGTASDRSLGDVLIIALRELGRVKGAKAPRTQ